MTYEAASARPLGGGQAVGERPRSLLARKNLGATGICFCGSFRSGIVYRGRPWATTLEDRELALAAR